MSVVERAERRLWLVWITVGAVSLLLAWWSGGAGLLDLLVVGGILAAFIVVVGWLMNQRTR